jgi:hypothetical protein
VVQTWDKLNGLEPGTVRDGRNEAASAFGFFYDARGRRPPSRECGRKPETWCNVPANGDEENGGSR